MNEYKTYEEMIDEEFPNYDEEVLVDGVRKRVVETKKRNRVIRSDCSKSRKDN
jgi:hypothetical protein